MNKFRWATMVLAKSCDGNPVLTTVTVMLFYVMFNIVMASIERLIFGDRFEHWLDPVFMCAWIAYSAYAVYWCAIFNESKGNKND